MNLAVGEPLPPSIASPTQPAPNAAPAAASSNDAQHPAR
jgi:hypothetical protein